MDAPAKVAQHLVSGSKRRLEKDGFDLDLTYVTPRIVALGLPAVGVLESKYRNPLSEVRAFLDRFHGAGGYALCNLCDERDYPNEVWPDARIMRFPFPDHHPPCMAALARFVERAAAYLAASDSSLLAVHCKAGKGRTGVMVCALLMHLRLPRCSAAEEALRFFRATRTTDLDAVNMPSQIRYVRLFERLLEAEPAAREALLRGPPIQLRAITLSSAPATLRAQGNGSGEALEALASLASLGSGWNLELQLSSVHPEDTAEGCVSVRRHVITLGPVRCAPSSGEVRFELSEGGLRLQGDIYISIRSVGGLVRSSAVDRLGWLGFHTSWLGGRGATEPLDADGWVEVRREVEGAKEAARVARFPKEEVDHVAKDRRFPADWELRCHFEPCSE